MTYVRHEQHQAPHRDGTGRRPERFYASVIGSLLGFGALLVGLLVQRDWDVWALFTVGVASGGSTWGAIRTWDEARGRLRMVCVAAASATLVLMVAGMATQTIINGDPILAVSKEARANQMVSELLDDLQTMAKFDELLAAGPADARARYNDYEPAAKALLRIANKWSRVDLGSLPDPDLIEVVQHVKTGATFGAKAVELRQQIITEPDDRAEAAMRENRNVFVGESLNAGAKLRPLAEKYQVRTYDMGGLE